MYYALVCKRGSLGIRVNLLKEQYAKKQRIGPAEHMGVVGICPSHLSAATLTIFQLERGQIPSIKSKAVCSKQGLCYGTLRITRRAIHLIKCTNKNVLVRKYSSTLYTGIQMELKTSGIFCKYGHVRQAKGGAWASPGTHPTLETNKQSPLE